VEEPGRYRILRLLRVLLRPYKHPDGGVVIASVAVTIVAGRRRAKSGPPPIGDPQSRIPMTGPSSACKRGETQSALLRRNELGGWWMLSRRIAVAIRRAKESRTEQELGSGSCSPYNTERRRGQCLLFTRTKWQARRRLQRSEQSGRTYLNELLLIGCYAWVK